MISIFAKCDCGCCTAEMKFNSITSAEEAFKRVGLGNGMTIVDDAGEKHESIDTFYGFSTSEEEESSRSLGYLFDLVTGSRK